MGETPLASSTIYICVYYSRNALDSMHNVIRTAVESATGHHMRLLSMAQLLSAAALHWMVCICLRRDEIGEFYAIDIGGTNFRSIHATLSDKKGELVSCANLPASHLPCALRCSL